MTTIKENLFAIHNRIADYEKKYDRAAGSVHLLAASKMQSIEKIKAAYEAGQFAFGENYVQEALEKIAAAKTLGLDIDWHFIGPLQSNKTKKIAEHFAWAHSIDNEKIAKRLHDQRPSHLPPLNICIQVNVSQEASKSGIDIEHAQQLAAYCLTLPRLKLRGLMTLPELTADITQQRAAFHKILLLWQTLRAQGMAVDTLSMGMSLDFEAAIAEGATLIRIGTAIFGGR